MGGRHGRRFGYFAGGFSVAGGMGGRAFRAGRRLASGDLQLVLLALLAERASHGYELIKALEERSGGFYSPSPGMIYPALTWLEEVGYASVAAEGAKKLYSITEAGASTSGRTRTRPTPCSASSSTSAAGWAGCARSSAASTRRTRRPARGDTRLARRELRAALREERGAAAQEQSRIAAILRSAAAQIRGKS